MIRCFLYDFGAEGWVFFGNDGFGLLEAWLGLCLGDRFGFCDRRGVGKWLGVRVLSFLKGGVLDVF
jgi:hypothetical protein